MEQQPQNMKLVWTGRVISTLVVLPFTMGIYMSFSGNPKGAEGMAQMGIPVSLLKTLGLLELLCAVLYAIPQTAVLGAILFTGYLGGAIITHMRLGQAVTIPLTVGVLVWLGLYLRDSRLRGLIPLRTLE
jgi:hypothetical protein